MNVNLIFKKPFHTDVVLLYPNQEDLFRKYVFREIPFQTIDVGSWICLHPSILFRTLKLLISIKLNIKPSLIIKDIYEKHLQAYIESIEPKVVITFIDDSGVFHRLSRNCHSSYFMAIQNGMRPNCYFKYLLPKYPNRGSLTSMTNYFCHGTGDIESFRSRGHKIDNYFPIGSLVGGVYWKEISQKAEQVYDICYISSWVSTEKMPSPDNTDAMNYYLADTKASEVLEKNLKKLIAENKYSVIVALKYDSSKEEMEYFYSIFGDSVEYQSADKNNFSTYKAIDKSQMTLTTYSTCAAEALGIGKRALFANGSGDDSITIKESGFCSFEGSSYPDFRQKINKILNLTDREYSNEMNDARKKLMNYDLSELPHDKLYTIIKNNLDNRDRG